MIEQAICTLAETSLGTDYRIVARSAGLLEADARELTTWCPTHDALLDSAGESLNFHPLPSGAYCVSRTTASGWAYDSHGAQQTTTHCLVVPPELLARFANNPFALIRMAMDSRLLDAVDRSARLLEPVFVLGGAATVDAVLLAELADDPGPRRLSALVCLARNSVSLALADAPAPAKLMEGLLNCLPLGCRLEFSFATGLKFSPRRPFRLVTLSHDPAERLWAANHPNVTVFALDGEGLPRSMAVDGWARLIERVLSSGRVPFLAAQLAKHRHDLSPEDLPALGLQLLEEIDAGEFHNGQERALDDRFCGSQPPVAHAAHRRFGKSAEVVAAFKPIHPAPATCLDPGSPEVLERLGCLDDLVYEALNGQASAMQQLRVAWPKVLAELGQDLLAESREQYLRYAMSAWQRSANTNGVRDPTRAVQALDILCLLFGGA